MPTDLPFVANAHALIASQLPDRTAWLRKEFLEQRQRSSAAGARYGSGHLRAVRKICEAEVDRRGALIWMSILRAVQASGVEPSDDMRRQLTDAFDSFRNLVLDDIDKIWREEMRAARASWPDKALEDPWARSRAKQLAEINLFVTAAASRAASPQGAPTFAIYAPVGAILTGPGSNASISQTIGQGEADAVLRAMGALLARLEELDDVPNATQVQEVASDLRDELRKEEPNALKVRALVVGAGEAIRTLPGLRVAYEMLKTAALQLGIPLP
jgi:hypothetical protein